MQNETDPEKKTLDLFLSFLSELIDFNPDNEDLKKEIKSLCIKLVYAAPEVKSHVFFNGCKSERMCTICVLTSKSDGINFSG